MVFLILKKSFIAKDTNIKVHKDIFGNDENDPRLYGTSSFGDENKTVVNKGILPVVNLMKTVHLGV